MKTKGGIIGVRLKPGAKREKVVSVDEREICIAVAAPPVDGKANKALIKFLARVLDAPQSTIAIRRGVSSRIKLVELSGITKETAFLKIKENYAP
ncbi:MAG: DUF167 domain-containing protein [Chitinivibrionales bacterium]